MFVHWVWFCLGDYILQEQLNVCKHLTLPSTSDGETASFSRARPWAGDQSSYPIEVKAGWQSTWSPWEHTPMLFLKCNGVTHAPLMLRVLSCQISWPSAKIRVGGAEAGGLLWLPHRGQSVGKLLGRVAGTAGSL